MLQWKLIAFPIKCRKCDHNIIFVIGMDNLVELKCLYLHNNRIEHLKGLSQLVSLTTVNLSNNLITSLSNLSHLPNLQNLNVSRCGLAEDILHLLDHFSNQLNSTESVRELSGCSQLSVLDLSDNQLEEEGIYDVLASMPELHVLCLSNNHIVRETKDYRRWMIYRCAKLTYLDGRPIHVRDRACIQAWKEVHLLLILHPSSLQFREASRLRGRQRRKWWRKKEGKCRKVF